jgi:hypothetical protein
MLLKRTSTLSFLAAGGSLFGFLLASSTIPATHAILPDYTMGLPRGMEDSFPEDRKTLRRLLVENKNGSRKKAVSDRGLKNMNMEKEGGKDKSEKNGDSPSSSEQEEEDDLCSAHPKVGDVRS